VARCSARPPCMRQRPFGIAGPRQEAVLQVFLRKDFRMSTAGTVPITIMKRRLCLALLETAGKHRPLVLFVREDED
jgi:hypothetical protein